MKLPERWRWLDDLGADERGTGGQAARRRAGRGGVARRGRDRGGTVQHRQVGARLIGEEAGEALPVDVIQGLLRAGVQRLSAHQQPSALRPRVDVDQPGELGDGCAVAVGPVGADRRCPRVGVVADRADRLFDLRAVRTDTENSTLAAWA